MPRDPVNRALRIARLAHSLGNYDSNVIGMVGEVIAKEALLIEKAPRQTKDIDGHIQVNGVRRSVQVKTLSSSRIARHGGTAKFRIAWGAHPERLVVLLVLTGAGKYRVIYNGDATPVGKLELVKGVQRRGIRVSDLYTNREQELRELVSACKGDA